MSTIDPFLTVYRDVIAGLPSDWEVEIKSMAGTDPKCRFRAYAVCNRTNESTLVYGSTEILAIARLQESLLVAGSLARLKAA